MSNIGKFIKKAWIILLDALYPPNNTCVFCDNEAVLNSFGVCEKCASRIVMGNERSFTVPKTQNLDGVSASFRYTSPVSDAIKRFKYNNKAYLARRLAVFMEIPEQWQVDLVCCVPMSDKKRKKRGYNQSELLAIEIAEKYDIECDAYLLKKMDTTVVQSSQNKKKRMSTDNSNLYSVNFEKCEGKNILIVDDVCTTGETLGVCGKCLKSAGANMVYGLVIAIGKR